MFAFLLARIPWLGTALSIAPWIIAAAGAGGTLWYRGQYVDCQASVAIDANKAEERLRGQQEADTELRRQLSDSLAPILNDLRSQTNATQIALARVQSDPRCTGTPAARTFDQLVRPTGGGKADPGAAGKAGP